MTVYAHGSLGDDVKCDNERSKAETEQTQRHDHQPQHMTATKEPVL